ERGKQSDEAEFRTLAFRKALIFGRESLDGDEMRALAFDNDASGGYLAAPEQFVNELIKGVDDMVFMRGMATTMMIDGAHSLGVPSLAADPADADWTAEVGAVSEDSTMSFGKRELQPHLLTKLIKVSMKLLRRSAMPAEMVVMDRLRYKFGITLEKAYLTGSGASQPLGVFTASSNGISTSRDVSTGNTTTSIQADGLMEAKYSLKGQYHTRAQWIFHRDGVKQVAKLKDGDGQYIWQPGLQAGQPDRLLQMPINMSEYAPNTFTTGQYVGILGDFSNYWIVDSMAMAVQRLNELYAGNNQVGFIGRLESDGMPVLEEAFARVKLA
ncbi:MAG TPA: phage major capsid protein, partial [Thiohalobacter sp.]|nr:phage major capsid protein [Thiohalobacter sp.]